jgi:hypothetical protein
MTGFARITMLVILAMGVACGGQRGGGEAAAPAVDPASPVEVAEAFYAAIDEGDIEAAAAWVLPEQQEGFREAMVDELPDLRDGYEVVVLAQGDQAEASVAGCEIEVDMKLVDGRWWIYN